MIIIPAIDIINGRVVRLTKGDFLQSKVYSKDCLTTAKEFEAAGLKYLHLVDLDGAKSRKITNLKILEKIATNTSLKIDFGGGVQTKADVESIFNAGAEKCTLGSVAAIHPDRVEEWTNAFGTERFLIGADVLRERIRIGGWQEDSGILLIDFLERMVTIGLNRFFCTEISRDGMMKGPAIKLYKMILKNFPGTELIASGGVSSMDDLYALKDAALYGVIVGKAIYENAISLKELSEFN